MTAKRPAFITLEEHKPNFQNRPTCRLINPTKSEIGNDVLKRFEEIPNKARGSFIGFDVCDFYPSTTENLLLKAIYSASTFEELTDN